MTKLLEMKISLKKFGDVVALNNISISMKPAKYSLYVVKMAQANQP